MLIETVAAQPAVTHSLETITEALAATLGQTIVIEQEVTSPTRQILLPQLCEGLSAPRTTSVPILAGAERLGTLTARGRTALDDQERRLLSMGASIVATEILRTRGTEASQRRLTGEALSAVLDRGVIDRTATETLSRLGLDTGRPHVVIAVALALDDVDTGPTALARARPGATLAELDRDHLVILSTESSDQRLDMVARQVADLVPSSSIGVSSRTSDLRRGLREALACARFSSHGDDSRILRASQLGAMKFLLSMDDPGPLDEFVEDRLGPLLADERAVRGGLVETLRAFVDSDGHHRTIAARCHIHPSTVKYRLARLSDILGCTLSDAQVRFELRMAVAVADVLAVLGVELRLEDRSWGSRKGHPSECSDGAFTPKW